MASIFRRIFARGGETSGALSRPTGQQINSPYAYQTPSASAVTVDSALQLSAVWACVKLLAESVASLPLEIFDVDKEGSYTLNKKHSLAVLFGGKVNRFQNRMEFFETMMLSLALRGNCYALKQTNLGGDIIGLMPMIADQMDVVLLEDGTVVYQYQDGTNLKIFSADKIWHVRSMGNGLIGLAPLDYMRNSVGVGQAAEGSVSKMYRNGAKPGGILTIDRVLKEEQRTAIKKNFADLAEGVDDTLLVLEADMKYQQVKMSPIDIELLSTRKFQIEDICRFFGVPPVLIGFNGDASVWGSGFDQVLRGFYKLGLSPYLERFQLSIETNLLPSKERGKVRAEFDADAFLRLAEPQMVTMLKEGIAGALFTPNAARKRLGEPPIEGGNSLFLQQQMFPIEKLADPARIVPSGSTPGAPTPPENVTAA